MTTAQASIDEIAGRILAAGDAARAIPPISDAMPSFSLAEAYRVSAAIADRRVARGEGRLGWKIGFTNRTIWDEYGVHAPIWGPVYDSTVAAVRPPAVANCTLAALVEPRIEPEIVFRMAAVPDPAMDEAALIGCIDGVAHGFEIVQSLFPGWRFRAADTVAAFGLHGRLFVGPFAELGSPEARTNWLRMLAAFDVVLTCDGTVVDRGHGANVLDGPLSALLYFLRGLAEVSGERLRPGDIVTTGTVTRAFPISAGERWSTQIEGLPLPGLALACVC